MGQYADRSVELTEIARRSRTRVQSPIAWPIAALAILGACGAAWFTIFEFAARL